MSLDQILTNCKNIKTVEERSEQVKGILAGCSNPQDKSVFRKILNAFFVGNNELVDSLIDELSLEQAESLDGLLDKSIESANAPVLRQYSTCVQSSRAASTADDAQSKHAKHKKRPR